VSIRTRKEKYKYDLEAGKKKLNPKNTIVQMKEKEEELILKLKTSYT
jgi:hypothetical protein